MRQFLVAFVKTEFVDGVAVLLSVFFEFEIRASGAPFRELRAFGGHLVEGGIVLGLLGLDFGFSSGKKGSALAAEL